MADPAVPGLTEPDQGPGQEDEACGGVVKSSITYLADPQLLEQSSNTMASYVAQVSSITITVIIVIIDDHLDIYGSRKVAMPVILIRFIEFAAGF